jgi:hypothetical protein
MKKCCVALCVLTMLVALPVLAGASMLTFDEWGAGYSDIPDGYGEFHWVDKDTGISWGYINAYSGAAIEQGTVSKPNVAYNGFGVDVWITRDSAFTFNGAYFTAWYEETLNIVIKGYLGSTPLFETTVVANSTAPVYASLNWSGIDRLTFSPMSSATDRWYNHFSMDNFKYNEAVPIPGAVWLLGSGLLGLIGLKRRFLG